MTAVRTTMAPFGFLSQWSAAQWSGSAIPMRPLCGIVLALSSACASPAATGLPAASPTTQATAPNPTETEITATLGAEPRAHVTVGERPCRGAETPLVTIVEFVDFHSPFVRKAEPVVERLLKDYEGDLRVCVRHYPVVRENPSAGLAAEAAEEAYAQGGATAFFLAYRHLITEPLTPDAIEAAVVAAHLDAARFDAALAEHRHRARIRADVDMAVESGHTGAPTFFIQGIPLGGARPYSDFQRPVEQEMTRARRLMALGVPRAKIFDVVLAHAQRDTSVERGPRAGEPGHVWIRTIAVSYGGYGLSPAGRTREEAHDRVNSLLARIRAGEDFQVVARQGSEGSTAPLGGDHGALRRGDLTAPIEDAAFALPVGGVSDLIEGEHGFSIVQRYR